MARKLKATHEGKLKIGDAELNVAVLEDGTRVITQSAVFKAFGRTKRGRAKDDVRVLNRPAFVDAKNLQPFIDEGLEEVLEMIEYKSKSGNLTEGFNAEILPRLCKVYLDARQSGSLVRQQLPLARASEILLISLSKVGITALVDEATGYQYERERDELQKILKNYISAELLPWSKTFPDEFYKQIFRLKGWDYTAKTINKRPGVVGHWTNSLIYKQLPPGVLEELKTKTPKSESGNYTARFFQSLTPEIGNHHLQNQLVSVITLMKISRNWDDFMDKFNQLYGQTSFDFPEDDDEPLSGFNQKLKRGLEYNPRD
ncbi:P63C domain-containing protein [Salinimicrobium sp. HB62]|uniref:P63C domain-containing protein n=1 Tax=Salinimicrobium sp. HB62 TaxID=3077781 RepID=UPI002D7717A9|nr:P63C domain-containing protein [Salinimicrobium sp. HB62]